MSKTKRNAILTPKTLLGGIAGISLIVGMSLVPVSFAYASGNESPDTNVSDSGPETGETANPAREAAENSMSKLGLNMENSAREIADTARKGAEGAHKAAENKMSDQAKETSDHAKGMGDQAKEMADRAKENASHTSNQPVNQPAVDKNAPPMVLSDFISSLRKGNSVAASNAAASNLELRYTNGWKEEIDNGRYVLVDPNGHKIISRPVTKGDISRMRSALK